MSFTQKLTSKRVYSFALFTLLMLVIFSTLSCKSELNGEGERKSKEFAFNESVDEVKINTLSNVRFVQSDSTKVLVEAQQNIIDNIQVEMNAGKLTISESQSIGNFDFYEVFVFSSQAPYKYNLAGQGEVIFDREVNLNELDINISDEVIVKNLILNSKEVKIELLDQTEIYAEGNATTLNLSAADKSKGHFELLKSNVVEFDAIDNSELWVFSEKELIGNASDNATIHYKGNPEKDVDTKDRAEIQKE